MRRTEPPATAHRPAAAAGQPPAVLELVHDVMHRYRSLQYQALRAGPHEITHMESKVLEYFGRHPGATQATLAQHSGRDKAQLARLVKSLRERGLLQGAEDAADRRSVTLALTEAGRGVLATLQQQARKVEAAAMAGLSAQERQALAALLERVRDNLAVDAAGR